METIFALIWTFLNSPIGMTLVVSALGAILGKIYLSKPLWKKYEGVVISAVKMAEKAVPDGSENKAVARTDAALKYIIKVLEESGKKVKSKEIAELTSGIAIVHDELVLSETLTPAKAE
jgi:hypothetical protein